MKWLIKDRSSYDRVAIIEAEPRPDDSQGSPRLVAIVVSPTLAFLQPTEADRAEMLATAREIVESHNLFIEFRKAIEESRRQAAVDTPPAAKS